MPLPLPASLSPSKVSSFTDCALAFRFSAIDRLPEPPSLAATRGTLVHAALERLFCLDGPQRTLPAALACLDEAAAAMADHPDLVDLGLDEAEHAQLLSDARRLVEQYFRLEDPQTITPIGIELKLEVSLDGLRLRGIIDRLELDADGNLVVTDYKTGRAPGEAQEQQRLAGVAFYSLLCERLFGRRPAKIQLLYLSEPVAIIATPSDRTTRGVERRLAAIWAAVERACEREDFRPNPSRLCDWCAFKAYCPAFGGDIAKADEHRRQLEASMADRPLETV
ncbi:MAG TPA: PD-(D/E)XK nuclease family protein [Acidimicrobiales bacterium]|nr:PD-(D/E)XK nuclease family protein [Acidimicrobiales bacterium]